MSLDKELIQDGKKATALPNAVEKLSEIKMKSGAREPVIFLDYDGTLTPIVANPEDAILPEKTKRLLIQLAEKFRVGIISGRDRADVKAKVGIDKLIYAGSHGFDITGPDGMNYQYEGGQKALPALDEATTNLNEKLKSIVGVKIERKKYAIAVHYRNVNEKDKATVKEAVSAEIRKHDTLKEGKGKKIRELKPAIEWHKGRAISWILDALSLEPSQYMPVFLGDDITDEDAFIAVEKNGIGVLVGVHDAATAAAYRLSDTEEVPEFLSKLIALHEK